MRLIDIEPYEKISPYTIVDYQDWDNGWIYTKDIPTIEDIPIDQALKRYYAWLLSKWIITEDAQMKKEIYIALDWIKLYAKHLNIELKFME